MRHSPISLALIASFALILAACGGQESAPPPAKTAAAPSAPPRPAVVPTAEGHFSPAITAEDFAARVKGNGIEGAAAENIAQGRMDLRRLFDMWMNSPPHRRNLLDPRFTRFGLAYARDAEKPDWRYWALVLGK